MQSMYVSSLEPQRDIRPSAGLVERSGLARGRTKPSVRESTRLGLIWHADPGNTTAEQRPRVFQQTRLAAEIPCYPLLGVVSSPRAGLNVVSLGRPEH